MKDDMNQHGRGINTRLKIQSKPQQCQSTNENTTKENDPIFTGSRYSSTHSLSLPSSASLTFHSEPLVNSPACFDNFCFKPVPRLLQELDSISDADPLALDSHAKKTLEETSTLWT
jgi:hypothetical protein